MAFVASQISSHSIRVGVQYPRPGKPKTVTWQLLLLKLAVTALGSRSTLDQSRSTLDQVNQDCYMAVVASQISSHSIRGVGVPRPGKPRDCYMAFVASQNKSSHSIRVGVRYPRPVVASQISSHSISRSAYPRPGKPKTVTHGVASNKQSPLD
ncbi:unnamed protein product [Mytilus edulis]|uniref:Uncharacterized protein n=1 Tax=Mytilus edulis TaxID=6550 RepID=A0A8S3S215_MYTED|nr:unnamed protein product [Mytilus edulis]